MAEQSPTKTDINTIFKRLRSIPTNKACFDCGTKNPTWSSITFGVFICIDCSSIHRSLGVHLSFVRSTQLDTNWTWLQLRAMQVGGNSNAIAFFNQHGCYTTDAQQKYNSRAAQLYKEKLLNLASTAMKEYGIKTHIDYNIPELTTPEKQESDFFEEHVEIPSPESLLDSNWEMNNRNKSQPHSISNGNLNTDKDLIGPNVEAALSISPSQVEPRKSTIGARKPLSAKKGLGMKKGLGAQKVKTDFNEIEKEAQMIDKQKETKVMSENISKEEEEKTTTSMRLAYQDLSIERKKQEEQLKRVDPKKAEQIERLGMGFGSKGGISHSAISDMKTIEQENPNKVSSFGRNNRDFFEDEFDFIGYGNSSSRFGDSSFSTRMDDRFGSKSDERFGFNKSHTWDSDRSEPKAQSIDDNLSSKSDDSNRSGRSRKIIEVSSSGEAQKKFGSAKAISSEQYFGRGDSDYEVRANLSRFEGSSSISSADYFGDNASRRSTSAYSSGPDFSEIKEGVKQSVTKVAGKLSTLANGVMSSLQRK